MPLPLAQIELKLKSYNQFYDNKSLEIRSREINGRLVLEGALRIYWGNLKGCIHLKEDDDQRTVVTIRKRNSVRYPNSVDIIRNTLYSQLESENSTSNNDKENTTPTTDNDTTISESLSYDTASINSDVNSLSSPSSSKETSPAHISNTLPSKLDIKEMNWDEIDELLVVERKLDDSEHIYRTMPAQLPSNMTASTLSEISTDLSMTDEMTNSYKTLGLDNDTTESSQTIYYSPLQSSNEKTPDEPTLDDEDDSTPTLKPQNYEEFKKQSKLDYITSANAMKHITDGTLKLNQPIDPSRICDSLKLYGDGAMSRSMIENSPGKYSLNPVDGFNINDTFNLLKNNSSSSSSDDKTLKHESNKKSPYLKKSISMGSSSAESQADDDSWMQGRGLLKSKSGPNHFQDYPSDTVKPSGKCSSISIKMDCYDEMSSSISTTSTSSTSTSTSATYETAESHFVTEDGVTLRRPPKTGAKAIKRRSGNRRSRTKLKRRCSINGHYYDRETSFFTPPIGSAMTVWVTSMVSTQEVINLVMEKYKIESKADNFGLYIVNFKIL
jgi:Ras association domain-containing protein 2/4